MLMLITNRKLCSKDDYIKTIKQAIQAGVDRVLLREKDLSLEALYPIALTLKSEMGPQQKLIIHSNIELACKTGADGLHFTLLDFLSLSKDQVRELKEKHNLEVGVSTHSLEEALKAEKHGASYILASHVFDTACKAGTPGRGCDFIQNICDKIRVPVIGLGGVNEKNLGQVLSSGASGIALMSRIMTSEDVPATCESLLKAVESSLQKQ